MKEKQTVTSCGFGDTQFSSGGKSLTPKSGIKWAFVGKKPDFSKETFNWDPASPTVTSAAINVRLTLSFKATDGKTYDSKFLLIKATVKFDNPEDLKVELRSG